MKCECKDLGDHDDWCPDHPWNREKEILLLEIERLRGIIAAQRNEVSLIYEKADQDRDDYHKLLKRYSIAKRTLHFLYSDKYARNHGLKYGEDTIGTMIEKALAEMEGENDPRLRRPQSQDDRTDDDRTHG